MNRYKKSGFTVVETMLFLSVSAVLAVGIIAGTGFALNQQRYRDSVNSVRSDLQAEFNQVSNTVNDRADELLCNSATAALSAGTGSVARGQSECVVMGRLVTSYSLKEPGDGGVAMYSYPLIGVGASDTLSDFDSDTDAIGSYKIRPFLDRESIRSLDWDARVRVEGINHSGRDIFSVMIVRSPVNGAIRTFVTSGNRISLSSEGGSLQGQMVDSKNISNLSLCVDPAAGQFVTGPTLAVKIVSGAANQSGVETIGEDNKCQS